VPRGRNHSQTYYWWRKEYGGLKLEQAKRLKELEKENSRLKRLVAELSLERSRFCRTWHGESPARRRLAVVTVRQQFRISERHFRAGDTVSGDALPVADPRLETVEF
jgi:hypothetical protein